MPKNPIPLYDEPLYEGALEALVALRDDGFTLGVATGKGRRGLAQDAHDPWHSGLVCSAENGR